VIEGPFINHEGLKRVYKPKNRDEEGSALMIKQISENHDDTLKFIESLKELKEITPTKSEIDQ